MLTIIKGGVGRFMLLIGCLVMAAAAAGRAEYRLLWIDVFHSGLRTRAEADTMMKTAREAGYNAVIIEVRKACDAFYNSGMEPKNRAVEAGFDPLQHIIDLAREEPRMDVYAWLVTYRARISGDDGWKDRDHVFQKHPEWLSKQHDGSLRGKADTHFLDPGVPEVIDYNLMVVRDILARYDVDGIVFDYLRYPDSPTPGNVWGYNDIALERFSKLYNRREKPTPGDADFSEFRRRQIYDQVRKVYAHVRAWRPHVKVGAATITWGSLQSDFKRTSAYNNIMQDWETMSLDGWLDLTMPMNYKREGVKGQARDHRDWAQFLADLSEKSGRAGINIVDGETLNSIPGILAQINDTRDLPGLSGISTYSYAEPRLGSSKIPDPEFFKTIREKVFTSPAAVPEATWLTRPTQGYIKGVVSQNGEPVDGAIVRLGDRETHTDGTGFYAFARVDPGSHQVTAEVGGKVIGTSSAAVQAGRVAEVPVSGP